MKRQLIFLSLILVGLTVFPLGNNSNAASHPIGFFDAPATPVDTTGAPLYDGDLITSFEFTDPDIYIINLNGFAQQDASGRIRSYNGAKRLFLNPTIFNFYGHLGGFTNVRRVTPEVRDSFLTWWRNRARAPR